MYRFLSIVFALTFSLSLIAQDKPAYRIFNGEGKAIKYKKVIKLAQAADVFFFGELHNDPIGHWLEQDILRDLVDKKGKKSTWHWKVSYPINNYNVSLNIADYLHFSDTYVSKVVYQ